MRRYGGGSGSSWGGETMATHYIFEPQPNLGVLCQGDVLQRTQELVDLLHKFHPHYALHASYKHFLVLTQSCDLYRRDSSPPNSQYISIAAVRPVQEALHLIAKKHQHWWMQPMSVLDDKMYAKLQQAAESLLDNNLAGYFYLHEDATTTLTDRCCAFLALSVAFRVDHYDLLLRAKVAQLKEPFQAKLGWLVGNMYSRVGTSEWNEHYGKGTVGGEAKSLLSKTFIMMGADVVRAGTKDLVKEKQLTDYTPQEIFDYIYNKKLVPREKQFWERATTLLMDFNIPKRLAGYLVQQLKQNEQFAADLKAAVDATGVEKSAEIVPELQRVVLQHVTNTLGREDFAGREPLLNKLVAALKSDAVVKKIFAT
jgi:hypothetical protein